MSDDIPGEWLAQMAFSTKENCLHRQEQGDPTYERGGQVWADWEGTAVSFQWFARTPRVVRAVSFGDNNLMSGHWHLEETDEVDHNNRNAWTVTPMMIDETPR